MVEVARQRATNACTRRA